MYVYVYIYREIYVYTYIYIYIYIYRVTHNTDVHKSKALANIDEDCDVEPTEDFLWLADVASCAIMYMCCLSTISPTRLLSRKRTRHTTTVISLLWQYLCLTIQGFV